MPQPRPRFGARQSAKATTITADAKRMKILHAVLGQVPFDGWTDAAYARGVEQAKISRGEADLLFPQGLRGLIELFGAWADQQMQQRIAGEAGFSHRRVRDKIAFAVRARLEALTPHREAMRRLIHWYALPTHVPLGAKRLCRTVDLMWRAAGDNATDFNFYTKRGLLVMVVKTTVLFWLDDDSPNCRATWDFLDRRIGEVLKLGKSISLMREWSPDELLSMVKRRFKRA